MEFKVGDLVRVVDQEFWGYLEVDKNHIILDTCIVHNEQVVTVETSKGSKLNFYSSIFKSAIPYLNEQKLKRALGLEE